MRRLIGAAPGGKTAAEAAALMTLRLVTESDWGALRAALPAHQARWAEAQGFNGQRHRLLPLPEPDGSLAGALWGLGDLAHPDALAVWDAAPLSERLPAGTYELATALRASAATQFCLGWLLGSYRFDRSRPVGPRPAPGAALVVPDAADLRYAEATAAAMSWTRDLINTPANELGPLELEAAARELAQQGAEITVVSGAELQREYPLIAAVGGGSHRPPRLIDCRWRRPGAPRVTLVGKGVCFDSGGLDLKSSAAMLLMKKDMGGAACALGLARLLQQLEAPVELRVLIPAVENSVGGNAYRPGDVWRSRKGLRVEIGNTDAEGRLVLADALAEADAGQPDLLIDLATLTGAARTALGPDLPAVFSSDESLARRLAALGAEHSDPLWPMPLWRSYDEELSSRVADLNNVSASPFGGAIIAALFLQRFVSSSTRWLHVDLFAWNPKERPGRPLGAEAQCVRAIYQLIRSLYG
ncbi:MAG TPA: leucyl aminopeptidase family protein [Steroidobacteraceae bacterium]|nr:leucyl aminopeptidase family protein [Steroidobacteraceae bacterium]